MTISGFPTVGDISLSGGANTIYIVGDIPGMLGYDFYLRANSLIQVEKSSTVYIGTAYGLYPNDPDEFGEVGFRVSSVPNLVNNIIPYAIHRYFVGYDSSLDFYFATVRPWGSVWDVERMRNFSTVGQSSWNSSALNISVSGNQMLADNRSINSLRLVDNHTVNLNGHTLSVNAGAFLTARTGRAQQINNGTITTAQDRYFFHIYGDRLSVSSNISGAGKELVKSGPGELVLYGTQANTYTGTTYLHEGTLVLKKSPNATAVRNIVVGDGGGVDTLRLDQSHQIDDLATVRLKGASRAKNMTAQGILQFNGAGGVGLTEKIHTLEVEGQGVINFAGGTLAQPNILETAQVLMATTDDTIFIRSWEEYADFFLVSRALAPDADALSRIWFEGWEPGAKLRDYNTSHWEIVPLGAPEPAIYGAILGTVGTGLAVWRKRRRSPYTALERAG